jgi:hypothetical protein
VAAGAERRAGLVDVNLSTAELVESLLKDAGIPVSRNWVLERLKASGHQTTRPRLNRVLQHYFRLGLAVEGSKGVQWTHNMSPQLLYAIAVGKRL